MKLPDLKSLFFSIVSLQWRVPKRSKRIVRILLVFLVLFLCLPFYESIATKYLFLPLFDQNNVSLKIYESKILDDLERLEKLPIFLTYGQKSNAEPFISNFVSWSGENNPTYDGKDVEQMRKVYRLYNQWRSQPEIFHQMISDRELMSVSTDWISQLHQFDHWNYVTNIELTAPMSIMTQVSSITRRDMFSQLPLPDYGLLKAWSLIHVIQLANQNQIEKGLKDFRKVAELMHSSGTLVGNITASTMLRDEFILVSIFNYKGWKLVPIPVIDSYAKISWAWIGIIYYSFFTEVPEKFRKYMSNEYGVCAGFRENASTFGTFLDFFSYRAPLESDFQAQVSNAQALMSKLSLECNNNYFAPMLAQSYASIYPMTTSDIQVDRSKFTNSYIEDYNHSFFENWIYLPYIRRLVGLGFFTTGSPLNGTVHYQAAKPKFKGSKYEIFY